MSDQSARSNARIDQHPVGEVGLSGSPLDLTRPRLDPLARIGGLFVKRALDIVGAVCLLAILSPLFLAIAAAVSLDGGPAVYRHRRIGQNGRSFDCLKFRTMIPGAEECLTEYLSYHPSADDEWRSSRKLDFDPRVTPIGAFLRRWSLDELPQLVNVLRGEMSLVGPRPVTRPEMTYYGPVASLYTSVVPGMTGLWQISGRNDLSYASRVALDRTYVERWSLRLDLMILLSTPRAVLRRCGAR